MSTRVRQETAPPSQRRPASELPSYEKQAFPLNKTAERALIQLTRNHRLDKLETSLQDAQSKLSKAAGELNDRLYAKDQAQRKRRERNKEQENESGDGSQDADAEQSLLQMRTKVQNMTQRMDESMRKLIDGQYSVQSMIASANKAAENTTANAGTQASTAPPPTQRSRGSGTHTGEGDDNESEYPDFTPTDPNGASHPEHAPPIDVFRSEMEATATRYQNHSMTIRYAENNNYRDFRRVVHDAQYPNEEVPLPHHSEWFNDAGVPAPGERHTEGGDEGEDDDLAVSRATISTKCPLTLQEFREPLMSKKCPHCFETDAFNSFFKSSATRVPTEPGQRGQAAMAVQCPVPGCRQLLYKTDLYIDAVDLRKIRRIQRAKEVEEDEAEDDNDDGIRHGRTQRQAQVIGDEDEEDDDGPDEVSQDTPERLKSESRGPTASARSARA